MKQRIGFLTFFTLIAAVCAFAWLCPNREFYYIAPVGEASLSIPYTEADETEDCEISGDGTVQAVGDTSVVTFLDVDVAGRCIEIKTEGLEPIVHTIVSWGKDGNFLDGNWKEIPIFSEETTICLNIPEGDYNSIKVTAAAPSYHLVSVDVYEGYTEKLTTVYTKEKRYLAALAVTFLVLLGLAVFDYKKKVSQSLCEYIRRRGKRIGIFAGVTIVLGVLSFAVELLLSQMAGVPFRKERFLFFYAVAFCVFSVLFFFKDISKKPEKLFLCISLSVGLAMIFSLTPGHNCWDFDTHYYRALKASYIGPSYFTQADNTMYYHTSDLAVGSSREEIHTFVAQLNELSHRYSFIEPGDMKAVYAMDGLSIAIGRFFGATYYAQYLMGLFSQLFIYSVLCYFAIKRLHSGKMLLAVIALFPTNLFLATNYSYDYWVTGFSMLGIAYYIAMLQEQDQPFSAKETGIMCVSLFLACLPKEIYISFLVLPFFLRKATFSKKDYAKYYGMCVITILVMGCMLLSRSAMEISAGGDMRGGTDVSTTGQIALILSEPLQYMNVLFRFLKEYLSCYQAEQYITHFAYLGIGKFYYVPFLLLIVTAFTDKCRLDKFKGRNLLRLVSAAFLLGTAVLIATALYVAFTPVGYDTILGCQPRYLIPLLFPFFALIANPGILQLAGKRWYHITILSVSALVLIMNMYLMITSRFV